MAKIHQDLIKQEARNRKGLVAAAGALFVGITSPTALLVSAPILVSQLQKHIAALHPPARALANQFTSEWAEPQQVETVDPLLTAKAAAGVVYGVLGTTQLVMGQGKAFTDALSRAVAASGPGLDRIAATETFKGFNKQVAANLTDVLGVFRWDAFLDKRTCAECERLAGKEWERIQDASVPPRHVNCRCILQFIPNAPP